MCAPGPPRPRPRDGQHRDPARPCGLAALAAARESALRGAAPARLRAGRRRLPGVRRLRAPVPDRQQPSAVLGLGGRVRDRDGDVCRAAPGLLTSGCSASNLIRVAVARNTKAGFDPRGGGMQNALQRMTVYCSEEAHSSIQKAVELLCFGRDAAPRPRERGHAYRPRGPDGGDQGRPCGRASTGLRRRGRGDDQHGRRGRPRRPLGYMCLGAVLVPHRLDAVPGPSRRGHSGARAGPTGLAGHGKLPLQPARPGEGVPGFLRVATAGPVPGPAGFWECGESKEEYPRFHLFTRSRGHAPAVVYRPAPPSAPPTGRDGLLLSLRKTVASMRFSLHPGYRGRGSQDGRSNQRRAKRHLEYLPHIGGVEGDGAPAGR